MRDEFDFGTLEDEGLIGLTDDDKELLSGIFEDFSIYKFIQHRIDKELSDDF